MVLVTVVTSVAIGRAFNVRQVTGDDPDEMGYAGPQDRV
jgi:hypothetical protein